MAKTKKKCKVATDIEDVRAEAKELFLEPDASGMRAFSDKEIAEKLLDIYPGLTGLLTERQIREWSQEKGENETSWMDLKTLAAKVMVLPEDKLNKKMSWESIIFEKLNTSMRNRLGVPLSLRRKSQEFLLDEKNPIAFRNIDEALLAYQVSEEAFTSILTGQSSGMKPVMNRRRRA